MGLSTLLTALIPLLGAFPTEISGLILFTLHKGDPKNAFENYLHHARETQTHDYSLLQQAAKALLEQGIDSQDPEIQLMCIFGAGVATSSDLLPILEKGIHSGDVKTQLIALSYLGKQEDDIADTLLLEALSSPFLIVRLEALLQLAKKNHPAVLGHLYSLSVKVPDVVRAAFAQIAVHLEGNEASRYIHKLLADPNADVRTETILAVAGAHRDDFLPDIHALANGASFIQQETAAVAFGKFKDQSAISKLKILAKSRHESVRLAAHRALFKLGDAEALKEIEHAAVNDYSLFAISALGELKEAKQSLYALLNHKDRDVRLNAILALLSQRDRHVLSHLEEILLDEGKDIGFWQITSPGGGLKAWKTISSSTQQTKAYPGLKGQTLNLREKILMHSLEFDEEDFLKIAQMIFNKKQHALVPLLIELLENKKSDAVIHLLKEGYQKAGAPLIRNYCTLALYRLKIDGPYEEQLIAWIKERGAEELIRFREEGESTLSSLHQLTPEETSGFLVETCQTLAASVKPTGIEALIHTIAYGNPKNRYALAGLLLRTTE